MARIHRRTVQKKSSYWSSQHYQQETGIKTICKKKKCKKAKWLSEEALQLAVKGREVKSKGEKEKRKEESCEIAVKGREVKSKGEKEDISI